MTAAIKLTSVSEDTQAPQAPLPAETALQREIDQLRVARDNVPWHLGVELVAQATGLPVGQPLAVGKTAPAPGSLARRLGFTRVEEFVTAGPAKNGLALRWSEFTRDVTAHGYRKRFALEGGTSQQIIDQVGTVSRILTRPPEDAAEFHRVVNAQIEHDLQAEIDRRKNMEKGLTRDRDQWKGRAEKAEGSLRTLEANFANFKAEQERTVTSLKADHERTVAELQSEHERAVALLQGDIKVLRSELDTVTSAREAEKAMLDDMTRRCEELKEALERASQGGVGDMLSLQDEISNLGRSLRNAKGLVKKERRRVKKLMAEVKRLEKLCMKREDSVRRATDAIRGLKAEREQTKAKAKVWHIASAVLIAVASAGWAVAFVS